MSKSTAVPVVEEVKTKRIMLPNNRYRTDFIRDQYYGESAVSVGSCDPELKANRSAILKAVNALLKADGQDEVPYQIIYAASKKNDILDPRHASVEKAAVRAEAKATADAEKAKAKADKAEAKEAARVEAVNVAAKAVADAAKAKK